MEAVRVNREPKAAAWNRVAFRVVLPAGPAADQGVAEVEERAALPVVGDFQAADRAADAYSASRSTACA